MKKTLIYILGMLLLVFFTNCQLNESNSNLQRLLQNSNLDHLSKSISPGELAHKIINEEPNLMIVDVRSVDAFGKFSLPGAINIPFIEWLNDASLIELLDCEKNTVVLIDHNGSDVLVAQNYLHQNDCLSVFILEGGLDFWVEKILIASPPSELADALEWEDYNFRKAAALYFTGESKPLEPATMKVVQKKIIPVVQRKKSAKDEEEEGC